MGLLVGCDTRTAPGGRDSGGPVITVDSGVTGTRDSGPVVMRDAGGPIDPSCGTAAARWIYVVDSNDAFLRFDPETNVVEAHMSNVRRKLEEGGEPRLIHTIRGSGYELRVGGG